VIDIRPLRDKDHDTAARIWLDGWRSTGLAVSRQTKLADLRERIAREVRFGWDAYLAWRGEEAVGFLALKIKLRCLDQIFLLPEAQGQGVGRTLFEFACSRMPEGFWLRTAIENAGACGFYERLGCQRGEVQRHPTLGHETVIYRWP
jgi:ribosomal protein S18 acetylase RimI-like enzyme